MKLQWQDNKTQTPFGEIEVCISTQFVDYRKNVILDEPIKRVAWKTNSPFGHDVWGGHGYKSFDHAKKAVERYIKAKIKEVLLYAKEQGEL